MWRYIFDIPKMIWRNVAPRYRFPWLLVFIRSLLLPFRDGMNSFANYSQRQHYLTSISGQVIYLEQLLNDEFDSGLRRIYISDAIYGGEIPIIIYQAFELKVPPYLKQATETTIPDIYLWMLADITATHEFDIIVPAALNGSFDEAYLRSLIDRFKIAGKRYSIIYI